MENEKNCLKIGVEKAMQKTLENHCRRRATPPHPRDTGHLKQGDGKREIGRLPRHRRRKNTPKVSKREPKGSQRGPKVSQK